MIGCVFLFHSQFILLTLRLRKSREPVGEEYDSANLTRLCFKITNINHMKKFFTLIGALALCSAMNAETVKMLTFGLGQPGLEEPGMMGEGLSADGNYICGALENGMGYFVGNLTTDQFIFAITDDDEGAELRNVDNNGLAIGYNGPGVTYSIDGVETVLATPEGYKYVLGEDISNDGSVMVGSLIGTGYLTQAAYSKDGGEWTALPMPPAEELGAYGKNGMSAAKYVSGDGKVIAGYVGSFGPAMLWMMNDEGEYVPDALFTRYLYSDDADVDDHKFVSFTAMKLSNNGKYLLLQGSMMLSDDLFDTATVAMVYDTEYKTLKIYDEPQELDLYGLGLYPTAIADDGTFVGVMGQPLMASAGSFIMKAGETVAQSLSEVFPEYAKIYGDSDMFGFSTPMSMSADGKVIMGYAFYCEDFYADEAIPFYSTWVIDSCDPSAVGSVASDNVMPEEIYSIDGRKLDRMEKGINIIRMSDGSVKKIMNR